MEKGKVIKAHQSFNECGKDLSIPQQVHLLVAFCVLMGQPDLL